MAHTKDAIIYDPNNGCVLMVVIPEDDRQLDDPSFNPLGMVHVRVPIDMGHKADAPLSKSVISDAVSRLGAAVEVMTPGLVLVINRSDQTGTKAQVAPVAAIDVTI